MSSKTTTWPDGTPRSQGNAFDWRRWDLDEETRKALNKMSDATKGGLTTAPRVTHYFQKAVAS
jgi:hypothetical protein